MAPSGQQPKAVRRIRSVKKWEVGSRKSGVTGRGLQEGRASRRLPTSDLRPPTSAFTLITPLLVAICCLLWTPETRAHGFHNAALTTSSLDQWLADVKKVLPEIDEEMAAGQAQPGPTPKETTPRAARRADGAKPALPPGRVAGRIETQLTPKERSLLNRKASDCLDVLAYLSPKNVIPEEFPDFELSKVPDYRRAAKQLLKLMGRRSSGVLVGRIENELTSKSRRSDVKPHPDYREDLMEVLQSLSREGSLTPEHVQTLLEAAQGVKRDPAQKELAAQVQEVFVDAADLPTFARTVSRASKPFLKKRLLKKADEKIEAANVSDLLRARLGTDEPTLQSKIKSELKTRKPTYAEIKQELEEIWRLTASSDREVAAEAREHVAIAFQRAPIAECLRWMGGGDQRLNELIWEQVDGRIERAGADRRRGYGDTAVAVLEHDDFNSTSKTAALELLARLDDARAVKQLVDVLPKVPRELWPQVGGTLRELTGQDFGPHSGDGALEVLTAIKRWRAWLEENGEP